MDIYVTFHSCRNQLKGYSKSSRENERDSILRYGFLRGKSIGRKPLFSLIPLFLSSIFSYICSHTIIALYKTYVLAEKKVFYVYNTRVYDEWTPYCSERFLNAWKIYIFFLTHLYTCFYGYFTRSLFTQQVLMIPTWLLVDYTVKDETIKTQVSHTEHDKWGSMYFYTCLLNKL